MISILILNLLTTLTFSGELACRGDNTLGRVIENNAELEGLLVDDTPNELFGNADIGSWIFSLSYGDKTKYLQLSQNGEKNNEPYKSAREMAQKYIFTEGRVDNGVDQLTVIPTNVYTGGNTQLCWSDNRPPTGKYYFGSGGQSHLCYAKEYSNYGATASMNPVHFYMIKNKCTTATQKAVGPVAADHPIFPQTDTANPVATHNVKKKSPDNKSKARTLKIYSDGTMAYFEGANEKGSFYMTGPAMYVDENLAQVGDVDSAKYLKVPRRRWKDGAENTEDILFKKDAAVDNLDTLKQSIDGVQPTLDAIWTAQCGGCGSEFINLCVPSTGGLSDAFDSSLDGVIVRASVEISSMEEYNSRSSGAVIILALTLLSFIFVAYSFCGKANKEDDAYEHLIAQEI